MTRSEIHRFIKVLEDRKAEVARALGLRLEAARGAPRARITDIPATKLLSLEDTLRAIQHGNFGRCAICGGEIPLQRQVAVRWSIECPACQAKAEVPPPPCRPMEEAGLPAAGRAPAGRSGATRMNRRRCRPRSRAVARVCQAPGEFIRVTPPD